MIPQPPSLKVYPRTHVVVSRVRPVSACTPTSLPSSFLSAARLQGTPSASYCPNTVLSMTGAQRSFSAYTEPSLVALDHVLDSDLWVPAIKYVVMSTTHSTCAPRSSLTSLPKPLRWPNIRVDNLISSGYSVDPDYMIGWDFDTSRSAFVPNSLRLVKPFVLAYHQTGDDTAYRSFSFKITETEDDELLYHVEVYNDNPANIWEYDTCSSNLAERRAQVSLGNGDAVVTVYRQASDRAFISLLVESLVRNRFLVGTSGGHATAAEGREVKRVDNVSPH